MDAMMDLDDVMTPAEKLFYSVLSLFGIFGFAYLFGAFVAASLDITQWDALGRFFIASVATIASFAALATINKWE